MKIKKTDPINKHDCPMCGTAVTGIHRSGSWRENDGGGMWFEGNCANCDIDFRLDIRNGVPGSWRMLAPDKTTLVEMISSKEFERLNKKLLRYKIIGKKWRAFKSKCHPTDVLWRYERDDGETAITIVREGTPIAEFRASGSL